MISVSRAIPTRPGQARRKISERGFPTPYTLHLAPYALNPDQYLIPNGSVHLPPITSVP